MVSIKLHVTSLGHNDLIYRKLDGGAVQLTERYGSKPLEFAKGKNAIALKCKEDVEPTLRKLKLAVLACEFDTILTEQVGITKPLRK